MHGLNRCVLKKVENGEEYTDVRNKSYGVIVKIICIKLFWSGLRLTIVIIFVKMFSCNFIVYLVRKKEIPQMKMDTIENESITS